MTMGEKILAMRKARGWSQEELADRIGVTRQAVSRWESGAAKPDADKIIAVCDLFGVSADYLLRDAASAPVQGVQETKKDSELGRTLREMTLDQWAGLLMIVGFSIVLLILKVLSILFPCWSDGWTGMIGFCMTHDMVWLLLAAIAGIGAGCWKLFFRNWLNKHDPNLFSREE